MTLLKELLADRSQVVSVAPSATVREAAKAMAEGNVGSVAVLEGERLAGIFTERDLVTRVLVQDRNVDEVRIADVMTKDLVLAKPGDGVGDAVLLMRKHHIRHLPILDERGNLLGVLSIRDLIREEVREMRDYIAQREG